MIFFENIIFGDIFIFIFLINFFIKMKKNSLRFFKSYKQKTKIITLLNSKKEKLLKLIKLIILINIFSKIFKIKRDITNYLYYLKSKIILFFIKFYFFYFFLKLFIFIFFLFSYFLNFNILNDFYSLYLKLDSFIILFLSFFISYLHLEASLSIINFIKNNDFSLFCKNNYNKNILFFTNLFIINIFILLISFIFIVFFKYFLNLIFKLNVKN